MVKGENMKKSTQNWLLIGAVVAVLVYGLGGGFSGNFHFPTFAAAAPSGGSGSGGTQPQNIVISEVCTPGTGYTLQVTSRNKDLLNANDFQAASVALLDGSNTPCNTAVIGSTAECISGAQVGAAVTLTGGTTKSSQAVTTRDCKLFAGKLVVAPSTVINSYIIPFDLSQAGSSVVIDGLGSNTSRPICRVLDLTNTVQTINTSAGYGAVIKGQDPITLAAMENMANATSQLTTGQSTQKVLECWLNGTPSQFGSDQFGNTAVLYAFHIGSNLSAIGATDISLSAGANNPSGFNFAGMVPCPRSVTNAESAQICFASSPMYNTGHYFFALTMRAGNGATNNGISVNMTINDKQAFYDGAAGGYVGDYYSQSGTDQGQTVGKIYFPYA